jgi:Calcium-dependent channel, 7TM region, putative phosphate
MTAYVPFLQSWSVASPDSFAVLSGVLPPAVSGLFAFFLPIIMRWLSQFMGALTQSYMDRAVVARYFAFLVISQLIIFTLISVVFSKRLGFGYHSIHGANVTFSWSKRHCPSSRLAYKFQRDLA